MSCRRIAFAIQKKIGITNDLLNRSLAPPKNPYRLSEAPTASSVYSQPSPGMSYDWPEHHMAVQPVSNYAEIGRAHV